MVLLADASELAVLATPPERPGPGDARAFYPRLSSSAN